jgi:peptidyl-tRNA hydrolase
MADKKEFEVLSTFQHTERKTCDKCGKPAGRRYRVHLGIGDKKSPEPVTDYLCSDCFEEALRIINNVTRGCNDVNPI